ncbi:MAG: tetratricopeptide repeat protein [Clostridiales bacterium]|nr:tetratricopeptide repeat protein [Clostridiales bacterium]
MKKASLAIILMIAFSLISLAQDYRGKGRVVGYVRDKDGNPIEGVTVKLFSLKVQRGFAVSTDKKGKWVAFGIISGGWNVDFEKAGYVTKKIFVQVDEWKKNPEINVAMEKAEGLLLTDELKESLNRGNALFEEKKYEEAAAVFEAMLEKYPDAHILNKNIGNCYANRGLGEKALEWYAKIEFEKIDNPVVLYNVGTNYYNSSKFDEALKYYRRATEIKKDFLDALYQLGLTYLTLGQHSESISTFENYLKIDPDSERAGQVRGFLDVIKKK